MALSFNLFFLPNHIASGGVSGLSVLAQAWLGIEPAFTQWALNIPCLCSASGRLDVTTAFVPFGKRGFTIVRF